MTTGAAVLVGLLAVAGGCGRAAEVPWEVPEVPATNLAEGLTATVPETGEGRLDLQRAMTNGGDRTYAVALEHDVKVRGRGQSALAIQLREEFAVEEIETVLAGVDPSVAWTVTDADVTVDPARDETGSTIEQDLERVSLKRPLIAAGVGPTGPLTGAAREVSDVMDRLLAPLPGREVAPGEEWPYRAVSVRTLDGGAEARVEREGKVHFEGLVTQDGKGLALLEAEWTIRISGQGVLAGGKGRVVEGTGRGHAEWLVVPETGVTTRGEAAEATHMRLEVMVGSRPQSMEQVSVLSSDLRLEDDNE